MNLLVSAFEQFFYYFFYFYELLAANVRGYDLGEEVRYERKFASFRKMKRESELQREVSS